MQPSSEVTLRIRAEMVEQRVKELQAALDTERYMHKVTTQNLNIAANTLFHCGYTYHGGEMWKPPLGPSPFPLFDKIDALKAKVASLTEQVKMLSDEKQHLEMKCEEQLAVGAPLPNRLNWKDAPEWAEAVVYGDTSGS